jgi:DNA polymerase-3 subunit beta
MDRDEFVSAVNWVGRTVSAKPANPVLGGVLVTGTGGVVEFAAFDYETSAEVQVTAESVSDGKALVSGRLLQSIAKALPRKPVRFQASGTSAKIVCGQAEFTLPMMIASEFPTLPTMPEATGTVDASLFGEAVAQTGFAAYRGEGREAIRGTICLELDDDSLTLVATDGFRAAARTIAWTPADDVLSDGQQFVVPARVIAEVSRFGADTVQLALGDLIGVAAGAKRTTTRGIAEEYPNWRRLLPERHTTVVGVIVAELAEALGRALAIDDRAFPHVRLSIADQRIEMVGTHNEVGGIREAVPVRQWGAPLDLTVNARYLFEALGAVRSTDATIGLTAYDKPLLIVPGAVDVDGPGPFPRLADDYLHLLMPVRGT